MKWIMMEWTFYTIIYWLPLNFFEMIAAPVFYFIFISQIIIQFVIANVGMECCCQWSIQNKRISNKFSFQTEKSNSKSVLITILSYLNEYYKWKLSHFIPHATVVIIPKIIILNWHFQLITLTHTQIQNPKFNW